jgi:DNA polymerase-3 subunit epsilon
VQLQLSLRVTDALHEALLVRGEPLDAVEAARLLLASSDAPAVLCHRVLAALVEQDQRFCWRDDRPGTTDHGARQVSLHLWEAPDPDLADVPFVALDLETTGARPGTSKITEIGAVRYEGLQEVGRFSTLVNPLRPIPPIITQITGITQAMVAGAPRIEEVIPELLEFLEGAVVVAHNASFDVGFLNYELRRLKGRRLGDGAIDTLPLARALAPGLPNYRLHTVAEALGAPVTACHRALADAEAAGHVFVTLVGRLQERGVTRLGEVRSYVGPASRSAMDKLRLTRDVPRTPGTYRFVDKDGTILYVGKADRLRDRVRSYFIPNGDHSRKVRQAVRLVDRIDWDEAGTPLEAVVREQELILAHRPLCNQHGGRPENYAYLKVGGAGPGLNLYISSRPPAWLKAPAGETGELRADRANPSRLPLVIGPFRGRTRLGAALELLQRCYPVRRCPRRPDGRPCVRGVGDRCLAPCTGDPRTRDEHDALVMEIVAWLTSRDGATIHDPLERAREVIQSLSRQKRYEQAQRLQEACEHLLSVCRSYRSLAEACSLCFAALWPEPANGHGPGVRMNLVLNGRLCETLSLRPYSLTTGVGAALDRMNDRAASTIPPPSAAPPFVAVPQRELDSLLAVRRWFHEGKAASKVAFSAAPDDRGYWGSLQGRLVAEALGVLSLEPVNRETGPAIY